MPPARPRVIDDARSETSFTNAKDRAVSGTTTSKTKKASSLLVNGINGSSRLAVNAANNVAISLASNSAVESDHDLPHIDWTTFPVNALHNYRSAYRLQVPSSYTQTHADLLYKSCDLALRAPSQILARRKARDLKLYRKNLAQQSSRAQTNGISKVSKASRRKENRKAFSKPKDSVTDPENSTHISLDEPPSPNSNSLPSQHDVASNPTDTASRRSPTIPLPEQGDDDEQLNILPTSLNQSDPESTVIGSLAPTVLSNSIRKHFNAQQLNEAEAIARFTYIVRQQGSTSTSHVQPLAQRLNILPLPNTTAENIARMAQLASQEASSMGLLVGAASNAATGTGTATTNATAAEKRANVHTAHSISAQRTLGGQHIEVEGAYGDGKGWIIGTTSCGRQVRMQDGGGTGTGTFRLRFGP